MARPGEFQWPDLDQAARLFRETGLLVLRNFLPSETLTELRELIADLQYRGMRKEFLMPQSQHTPRHMLVIGGAVMNDQPQVMQIYHDELFQSHLSRICGHKVAPCPELVENVIATVLEHEGDTHGWHVDDYPVALIICLASPGPSGGGAVEIERPGGTEAFHIGPGDAYLLRSDQIRHRVAPVSRGATRTILNFTYAFEGMAVTPNGSAYALCS